MDSTPALLRIAARVAGASAALVARAGDDAPVAAWGCDPDAARALLRAIRRSSAGGAWSFRAFPVTLADGTRGELLLVAPSTDVDEAAQCALAAEIGAATDPNRVRADWSGEIERLTASVDQIGEAVAILGTPRDAGEPSHFLHVNGGFTGLFGFTAAELVGKGIDTIAGPMTDRERIAWLRGRVTGGEPGRVVLVLYTRDRVPVWAELATMPVHDDGSIVQHAVTFRDITSRKQFELALETERRKLRTTLAAIGEAVVTALPDGRVDFVNAAAQRMLGIDMVEAYGAPADDLLALVDDHGHRLRLCDATVAGDSLRGSAHARTRTGAVDVAYVASRVEGDDGGVVIVLRDVTVENRLAMRLSFEATHDPLTGLPNRRAFTERLEEAVHGARERGEHHAVGFLDLDRFKIVNDRLGHAAGDRLLREVTHVMGRVVRGGDVLARIGGDEFALLLSNCGLDDARRVANKVRAAVDGYRIESNGLVLDIGVSIGLAAVEPSTMSAADALDEADAACYQAKAAGRNAIAG